MSKYPNNARVNELHPELMGLGGLLTFINHNSASRQAMGTNMVGQAIVNSANTSRRIMTGAEYEFSRFTFKQQMPEDGTIIAVIPKFPTKNVFVDNIQENPRTVVLFETVNEQGHRLIDVMDLGIYHCLHEKFGFRYKFNERTEGLLTPGTFIPKGTVFADSPNVDVDDNYNYGMDVKVALMSHPVGIEDGFGVSESLYYRTAARAYGKRSISVGKSHYLLNIYGDDEHYQPCPSIGDYIRDDRIVFAAREFNESMNIVDMMPARPGRVSALRKVNNLFDKRVYADKVGKVIDITVYRNYIRKSNLPTGMTDWLDKWHQLNVNFYENIIRHYQSLNKRFPDGFEISPQLEVLLTEANSFNIGTTNSRERNENLVRTIGGQPLDEYSIHITYEYLVNPFVGAKFSGTAGDKGVNVRIIKDEHMPIDKEGNRADIIADDFSTIKRMIASRPHEMYYGGSTLKVEKVLKQLVATQGYEAAWEYLSEFYKTISPRMWNECIIPAKIDKNYQQHIDHVLSDKISIWAPFKSDKEVVTTIRDLESKFPPCYDVVTYTDLEGNQVVTKDKILIAPLYFMLLEKTNTPFAATASTRYQHHGILATITGNERNYMPARNNPVKVNGESEVKHAASNVGDDALAEQLEQSNDPDAHKAICKSIYSSAHPTNIDRVIDRSIIPRGNSKTNQFIRSQFQGAGFKIVRYDEGKK
jgi:hypothetical protein